MCYNFDFLKKEEKYKDFTYACIEAEKSLIVSYASTAILARRALELAVKWVFSYDHELDAPYQDNLAYLIHDYRFKGIIDTSHVFLKGNSFISFSGSAVALALLLPMEKVFESYIVAKICKCSIISTIRCCKKNRHKVCIR